MKLMINGILTLFTLLSLFVAFSTLAQDSGVETVTGQTVAITRYDGGRFEQVSSNLWYEYNSDNQVIYKFREVGRDDGSVYLRDDSRQGDLQIDLHKKVISASWNGNPRSDLYNIISVTGALSTQDLLIAFGAARDAVNEPKAAEMARKLSGADFSSTPLTAIEIRAIKTEMSEVLLNHGDYRDAAKILTRIVKEGTIAAAATEEVRYKAIILEKQADRFLLLAKLYEKMNRSDRAINAYQEAHNILTELYGNDNYLNAPEANVVHVGESDPDVTDITRIPQDLIIRYGYEYEDGGHINIVPVTSTLVRQIESRAELSARQRRTKDALKDLYLSRFYILHQCGKADIVSEKCPATNNSRPLHLSNALAIAKQWEIYADKALSEGRPKQAYVALAETRKILSESGVEGGPLYDRIIAKLNRAERAVRAAGERIRPSVSSIQMRSVPAVAENFDRITVFYGTNRALGNVKNPDKTFNRKRGSLSYGSIEMTVPHARAVGSVPSPGLFTIGGAKDGVHIVLKKVNRSPDETAFAQELRASVTSSARTEKEAFVFVHGHGVAFADSARRAAQLAVDLDIRTGATFFSWPAGSVATGYSNSEDAVEVSIKPLSKFLTKIATESGADKIHIIAHSMGNRILLRALDDLEGELFEGTEPVFDQIIWASPDVNATAFADNISDVANKAKGMTLYASEYDRALQLSRWLHGKYPRAGQAPPLPQVASSISTVDTSAIARSFKDFIAHGDYAGGAITDLRSVVWLSLAPDARCILSTSGNQLYWDSVPKVNCPETEYRLALNEVRIHGINEAKRQAQIKIQQFAQEQQVTEVNQWQMVKSILDSYLTP